MTNKLIIIVGVLDVRGSTNIAMAKSLIKFGYNILPINYRTISQKYGLQYFANMLIDIVSNTFPELVIFCKGNGIDPKVVKECSKHSKTWLFNMDPKPTIDLVPEVVQNAVNSTFSSCTALDMVEWFNKEGANCHYIVQGVDPEVFRPITPNEKFAQTIDGPTISMIGSKTKERDEFFKALSDGGFFPKYYGYGYSKEVINREFAEVCSSSDFMLSLNTYNGIHKGYFSNRLVRYLSCGVCTLHYDPVGDISNYFEDGEEIILFKDKKEMVEKLLNIDEETKVKIAINGRERVLKDYTWDLQMVKLLNIVSDYEAKK